MLKEQLSKLKLEGELLDDQKTLEDFSHDASLFEIKPDTIVAPKNSEDLKKLVNFARENKELIPTISLTPRAAGSCMAGGSLNDSIILDFLKHFNHIQEIGDGFAIAEPGVYYRDFEKETLKHNLILPPFPASRELCALGGQVGNNGAGEKTLTHGKIEDYVLELNVVLQDGNEYIFKSLDEHELKEKLKAKTFEGDVYRKIHKMIEENEEMITAAKPDVSKNSAGYYIWNVWDKQKKTFDLTKLIVGSQGTLGIVTKIKFRLVAPVKNSKLFIIFLKDLTNLSQIVNVVLKHKPETFESYDDYTLKLAIRFLPDLIKILKPKNIIKLGFQFLPEFWMTLTGGFPKLVLMAEFTGDTNEEIDATMKLVKTDVDQFKVKSRAIPTAEEANKYWVIRRESFNLLRHHIKDKRTAPFIDDIIVKPEYLPEFLPKLNKILQQYDLPYTIAGHVGNGNFHIIPLMDMTKPLSHTLIPKIAEEVYALVLSYKGSITAEHNDGLVRSPYLKQMYGEKVYKLFEEIKNIFDPKNIFNPHKKVGVDLEYSLSKLVNK
ncbi:MAG: Oxidoreductase [Candidatus Doudnabacteria bacterium]|nr:Oxidoreductase [Candidatus Doudnabacteria bacterium]